MAPELEHAGRAAVSTARHAAGDVDQRDAPGTAHRLLEAAAAAGRGIRREGDRELPLGPKARRTRAALLRAAYERFVAEGYRQTTVADIAGGAGVSLGTFYQYFRDRKDVMGTLVAEAVLDTLRRGEMRWDPSAGLLGVRRVVAAFVGFYRETARFQAVWEEVTQIEPELAELRRTLARHYVESIEAELRRAQAAGLVRRDLDPALASVALNAMVDRYCYLTYVFDPPEEAVPVDESVDELTLLWINAIGLIDANRGGSGRVAS